jgi:hypothetical protein
MTSQHHNALFFAARGKHKSVLEFLLLRGINKTQTPSGETPIHLAASQEDPEIVLLLMEHGFSPYQQTSYGETILHIACRNGSIKILDFCLKGILDLPRLYRDRHHPIKSAITENQNSLIEFLIKSNPELLTDDLLEFAKNRGSEKTIKQLLTYRYCPWVLEKHEISTEKAPLRLSITNPLKNLFFGLKKVSGNHLHSLADKLILTLPEIVNMSSEELENALHQISTFYKKQFHRKPGVYALLLHTLFTEFSLAIKNYVKAREDLPHQESLELILKKEREKICPINLDSPKNPTRLLQPDGSLGLQSYERQALKTWIKYAKNDPSTKAGASLSSMIAFSAMPQKAIEDVLKTQKEIRAKKRKAEEIS